MATVTEVVVLFRGYSKISVLNICIRARNRSSAPLRYNFLLFFLFFCHLHLHHTSQQARSFCLIQSSCHSPKKIVYSNSSYPCISFVLRVRTILSAFLNMSCLVPRAFWANLKMNIGRLNKRANLKMVKMTATTIMTETAISTTLNTKH